MPWFPGRGNRLTWADVESLPGAAARDTLVLLEARARTFLDTMGSSLGVVPEELALNRERSGKAADHLWLVDFDVLRDGIAVEGARVVLRVNNGNLIQFGTVAVPAPDTPAPRFALTREQAEAALGSYIGGFEAGDVFLDRGSQRLLPTNPQENGAGYGLAAVWEFRFRRRDDSATWQARVDARSGEVLELYDVNRYAGATGGVLPDASGPETVLPMPYVDLSTGGYASSAGVYPYLGGSLSSKLDGRYVSINDFCGPISVGAGAGGNLSFGTSGGTDCATPGFGGAGNTHSSRTQYYHVQRAKDAALGWLPGNSWLESQLRVNVNLSDTCNAFWNGGQLFFFKSGNGCGNTGEMADVGIHEFGHGLDANDGLNTGPGEFATGETYGDVLAAMTFRDSCIGDGFHLNGTCGGYGDPCTECTGVRDIDWGRHVSATPHTVANLVQPLCPVPVAFGVYVGPCGAHANATNQPNKRREGHCESYVSSEAIWDLAARDLPGPGTAGAWAVLERLWYRSRSTAGRAFVCDTSTPVWTSHGCTVDSYWRAMRAADDDDGNLANGTPNSCHLFAAFDRHGIACPSDPGADVCHSACTPPAVPSVTLSADNGLVNVSWTSSGPGIVYDLYRGEAGCDAANTGSVKIASGLTATRYQDTEVANFFTYSYRVVAYPAGNEACSAVPSNCAAAQPSPCKTPGKPTGLAAATPRDHEVALTWTNGSPPAQRFNVYRARGTCSGATGFAALEYGVETPAFTDAGVSGTLTYAYRVTATDPTGVCESVPACVEVRPTGPCTAAPEFAGLAEVSNPGSRQCTLQLAWPAATPLCGGPVAYDVHRGTSPGFTPTAASRIAAVGGTTYADSGALGESQTYHYLVRARDLANGAQDGNLVRAGAAPTGPTILSTLVESFERLGGFDQPGWQTARTFLFPNDPGPSWTWMPGAHGGSAWFADEHTAPSGKALVSPLFGIGPKTMLSFFHRFALQAEPWYCRDGATLEISTDGGATWNTMPDSAFLGGGFISTIVDGVRNPLSGKRAWCGAPLGAMSQVMIDLGAFAGAARARLRWHEGDDDDTAAPEPNGWYVDSVTIADTQHVAACTPNPPGLEFHSVPPCRLLDTRSSAALASLERRELAVQGQCGIPADARALAVNVTVPEAEMNGYLQLFPANLRHPPSTSFLNFVPGQIRANNGILMLSSDGRGGFSAVNGSRGTLHFILDVNGYFQ